MEDLDATLHAVLLNLEQQLLNPAVRKQPAAAGALLAEEFREFGKSGRIYDKKAILTLLAEAPAMAIAIENFEVTLLSETAALTTWRSVTGEGQARRSSVWVRRRDCWLMVFHQGSPIPAAV